jgi:DNA-directed RNA polymerase specialized sigma24 family protein
LRDHGLAQDAVQDGFLKIWNNAGKYDSSKGSPMSWMRIIMRRAALDRLRSVKNHDSLEGIEVAAPEFEPRDPKLTKCLDRWLINPQVMVPGARMYFRLNAPQERADVIAYLKTQTVAH